MEECEDGEIWITIGYKSRKKKDNAWKMFENIKGDNVRKKGDCVRSKQKSNERQI